MGIISDDDDDEDEDAFSPRLMAPSHHLARSVGGEVAQLEVMGSSENRGLNAVTTGFLIPVTTGHGLEGFE